MRILHTADLHLGRHFAGRSLIDDHGAILDQILAAIADRAPDVLIIAGDVFDRAAPPESAVRQFNAFVRAVAGGTHTAIVIIAGNHDSGDRIGAMATLADGGRTLVRGPVSADEPPLVLRDAAGPVAISALPFSYEFAARECFADPDIKTPADVLSAQLAAARHQVPAGARWVVAAHTFVSGAEPTESERPLSRTVGGIETVPADVFAGAHYVALGHIHRPQAVGATHIRYAGAPLAFGFDEEGQEKSMTLVDLGPDSSVEIDLIPFRPLRHVRTLRGSLEELLSGPDSPGSDDLIHVVLTDPARLVEPMKRIRERYPNACSLIYERGLRSDTARAGPVGRSALDDPAALVSAFVELTRGTTPDAAEAAVVDSALAGLSTTDTEAAA